MKQPCIKIYLSGKMTGLTPEEYSKKFKECEERVKKEFGEVYEKVLTVNPDHKSINTKHGWEYEDCMEADFNAIKICDAIYLQKDWIDSKGSKRELMVALALNKKVFREDITIDPCEECVVKLSNMPM